MKKGTVKWYNSKFGKGMITPDDAAQPDVSFKKAAIQGGGTVSDGQRVEYELDPAAAEPRAKTVKPL